MFLVSKVVWLLAQPLTVIFGLMVLSTVMGLSGWRRTATGSAAIASLILFITLFTTTGPYLLQRLEDQVPRPAALPENLSCIIVLGGAFENAVMAGRGGIEFNQAVERFTVAARLARLNPTARILVSGGDGSLRDRSGGDAEAAGRFFRSSGLAPERLLLEDQSRTTFENVDNTAGLLRDNGLSGCALLTSAFHMPRALGLFRKQGIDVQPWPTDYRTSGNVTLGPDFTQPSLNTQMMTTAMREWVGLFGYFVTGRIHTPLPD